MEDGRLRIWTRSEYLFLFWFVVGNQMFEYGPSGVNQPSFHLGVSCLSFIFYRTFSRVPFLLHRRTSGKKARIPPPADHSRHSRERASESLKNVYQGIWNAQWWWDHRSAGKIWKFSQIERSLAKFRFGRSHIRERSVWSWNLNELGLTKWGWIKLMPS